MKPVLVAIICITALAMTAVIMGIDGALLASSFTVIGGLGGVAIKVAIDKRKSKRKSK